jgi:DNA (cytosine-5)-methyltransferase 1
MTLTEITTKGSLCTGYGGLDMALPGQLAWVSETNLAACRVLEREHPETPNLGDFTTHTWTAADRVDLLTAGFPCQPVSSSGSQLAEADPRFLWPSVHRAIVAIQPGEVLLENVENLARLRRGAILHGILADLTRAGYQARWTVLGACTVGAPHCRHRWFLRAVPGDAPHEYVYSPCGGQRGKGLLLPTPLASDAEGGAGDRGGNGGENLKTVITRLDSSYGTYGPAVRRWESIIGRPAPVPSVIGKLGGVRLNPELPEWMMGLPAGHVTKDMTASQARRLAGNGVVPRQALAARAILS